MHGYRLELEYMSIQRNKFDPVLCNRYLTTLWGQLML